MLNVYVQISVLKSFSNMKTKTSAKMNILREKAAHESKPQSLAYEDIL